MIRTATINDVEQILNIYRPYVEHTSHNFEYVTPTMDEFIQRYNRITSKFPWLVCEIDNKVIGYAYADISFFRAAYMWDADVSVYIDKDYHKKGIGRAFYKCLEEILLLQGYFNIYALIAGGNHGSCSFHKSMGYDKLAVLPECGFKNGEWHDIIWYGKKLKSGKPQNPPVTFVALDRNKIDLILERNNEITFLH